MIYGYWISSSQITGRWATIFMLLLSFFWCYVINPPTPTLHFISQSCSPDKHANLWTQYNHNRKLHLKCFIHWMHNVWCSNNYCPRLRYAIGIIIKENAKETPVELLGCHTFNPRVLFSDLSGTFSCSDMSRNLSESTFSWNQAYSL